MVKKGEKGVKIMTVIECLKNVGDPGNEGKQQKMLIRKSRKTTVFHISQTEPLNNPFEDSHAADEVTSTSPAEREKTSSHPAEESEPNWYEARQKDGRERYLACAKKCLEESESSAQQSREMADMVSFGQSILMNHYSASRDRRYRAKIRRTMDKSVELHKKSEHYQRKAELVGFGGIFSDDPAAIPKLEKELEDLQHAHEMMKTVNQLLRKHKSNRQSGLPELLSIGFTEENLQFCIDDGGFVPYALSNSNASIHQVKDRITELKARAERQSVCVEKSFYIYKECTEKNRVMFVFEGKSEEMVRKILKFHAFKWSPRRCAWGRMLNNNGIWNSKEFMKELDQLVSKAH